jgi:hypothetical protein
MTSYASQCVPVPRSLFNKVMEYVEDANARPRYQDHSFMLDDDRLCERGGFWNAADPHRAALGFTLADRDGLRRELRALGFSVTADDADALLAQAEMGFLRPTASDARREAVRLAVAARRMRARAEGTCIICFRTPVVAHGCSTCYECGAKANARKRAYNHA